MSNPGNGARELTWLDPRQASAASIEALLDRVRTTPTIRAILVPPTAAKRCVETLRGRGVRVASVAGYPLGLAKPTIKAIEATNLAKDGVDAVEVTPFPPSVIGGDWDALRAELLEIVRGARAARPSVAVDVRVDAGWVGDRIDALLDLVRRAAIDALIVELADGVRTRREAAAD